MEDDLDIAVTGVSCAFGTAANIGEYWDAIVARRTLVRTLDDDALRARGAAHQIGRAGMVRRMAALDDISVFDHRQFAIPARDADIADPQLRMMFTHASQALASAGIDPLLHDGNIGVFGCASTSAEWAAQVRQAQQAGHAPTLHEMSYVDRDFYMTRLAFALGLSGPAMLVNTACSSSLVAVHVALQSLLAGDCDVALAGACSIRPFWGGYPVQEGGIFSPGGTCAPFAEDADGTVPGEGAAFLVLKPLSAARAAGDRIFCVIKGSAVNNDGRDKPGYAAPAAHGQTAVIGAALAAAAVAPASLGYVECHGTGTRLGDPVEVAALDRALRAWGRRDRLHIGSVKEIIGHTDVVAGIAGLIKAALVLRSRTIPPQGAARRPNPLCRFGDTLFDLADGPLALDGHQSSCAGISSFGVGGTNVHVVIEAGTADFLPAPVDTPPRPLPRFDGMIRWRNGNAAEPAPPPAMPRPADRADSADPATMAAVLDILRQNAQAGDIRPDSRLQDLGIDSIAVLMITEELEARFGLAPTPAQFVELTTVADLAGALGAGRPQAQAPVQEEVRAAAQAVPDTSPLTFGQNRFFHPRPASPVTESYAAVFRLGAGIGAQEARAALAATILHHQALRSRFVQDAQGEWSVRYEDYPADGYFSRVVRGAGFDVEAYCRDVLGRLDFTRAPLFFGHLVECADEPPLLIVFTHHVIYDGHSLNIVLQDLHACVTAGAETLPPATPASVYAAAQRNWYRGLDQQAQQAYWTRPGWRACRPLPVDAEAGIGGRTGDESEYRHEFDAAASAALVAGLKHHKLGMLDAIVYAVGEFYLAEAGGEWLQMSCAFGGRSDVIGTQGHDFSRTVGLLALNGLMLLRQPRGADRVARALDVKRQLAEIPDRGLAYFIDTADPSPAARARRAWLPGYDRQVGVNFLGYQSFDTAPEASAGIGLVREFNLLPPDLERWYRLDFDFGFVNGLFFIGCRYARNQYHAATIARHVARIAADLRAVASGDPE